MLLRWLWLYAVLAPGCHFDPSGSVAGTGAQEVDGAPIRPVDDAAPDAVDAASDGVPADAAPPDAPVRACASNPAYEQRPKSRQRYRPVVETASWTDASDACAADDAHLVVLDSEGESDYVRGLVDGDFWIGLHDRATEGTFEWVNAAPLAFENWADGEPNNFFGGEDCVEATGGDALWNDEGCGGAKPFVCECGPGDVTPPVEPS